MKWRVTLEVEADSIFAVPGVMASIPRGDWLGELSRHGSIEPADDEAIEAHARAVALLS